LSFLQPQFFSGSQSDVSSRCGNTHFLKKLPPGAEASNVLVGEVDFLSHHVTAFVRLKNSSILGDLTEVPVPTRFLFVLLGPTGHAAQFKEIGRAIATLMSDEVTNILKDGHYFVCLDLP
jgi:sodium bicarbonate transporter 10